MFCQMVPFHVHFLRECCGPVSGMTHVQEPLLEVKCNPLRTTRFPLRFKPSQRGTIDRPSFARARVQLFWLSVLIAI